MPDALIVGAGIGGLAAGIALRSAGWTIQVLERASTPRELGFALLLAPNAMWALRQLGIADAVIAGGSVLHAGEMRRPDGTVLKRFDIDRVRDLLPDATATVLRPVIHGALLESVGSSALALESDVTRIDVDDAGVEAVLASGRRVRGRVLIGADGAGSVVRRQLHPGEPPPRRSGLFGLRGVARGVAQYLGSGAVQYFGRGVEAGLAPAGADVVYWYLSVPRAIVDAAGRDPWRVLERCSAPFHEPFRIIVGATSPDDIRLDELFDRPPVAPWGKGPVTLLGDAAHPMLPHAGQGAAQALEDAVVLGHLLARAATPETALREYERQRARRTNAIVRLARRNARFGSVHGRLARAVRDTVLRLTPERVILKSLVAIGRPPN